MTFYVEWEVNLNWMKFVTSVAFRQLPVTGSLTHVLYDFIYHLRSILLQTCLFYFVAVCEYALVLLCRVIDFCNLKKNYNWSYSLNSCYLLLYTSYLIVSEYTVSKKKQDTKLLPATSDINPFSIFFPLMDSVVNLQQIHV